jgi:thioredoxin-like negative regulator of GroEL
MDPKIIKSRQDFDAELKGPGRSLALFYSRWCPFCTAFLPDFQAQALGHGDAFLLVSTDDLPELEDAFSVEVVPTVLRFENGRLAARLDGVLGRGLNSANLKAFLQPGSGETKP